MAMQKRREVPAPNGSLIVWMAGIVLGAGAGVVLVYHLLLASHTSSSQPFSSQPMSSVYGKAPATLTPRAALINPQEISREHAQALRDATK